MNRRNHIKQVLLASLVLPAVVSPLIAHAEGFPDRTITLVVPFPAGGPTDTLARVVAEDMSRTLGKQVIVDNKAGANSIIGTQAVARARPDGYTLLMATPAALVMNPLLRSDLSYDAARDLDLLELVNVNPLIMVVPTSSPVKNLDDFIKLAKQESGKLSFASVGVGSAYQLAFELLQDMAGIKLNHVPYKGSSPALLDVMGGRIDVMFDTPTSTLSHIAAGKLRAIAVTGTKRFSMLPDVPAITERYPGYDALVWSGVVAPKGLPSDVRDKLKKAVDKSLSSPTYLQLVKDFGNEPATPSSAAELDTFVNSEREKWRGVIQRTGIKL